MMKSSEASVSRLGLGPDNVLRTLDKASGRLENTNRLKQREGCAVDGGPNFDVVWGWRSEALPRASQSGMNISGLNSDGCCVKSARGGANFLPVWPGANQRRGSRDSSNFILSSHVTFRNFCTLDFLHHVMFVMALNLFL